MSIVTSKIFSSFHKKMSRIPQLKTVISDPGRFNVSFLLFPFAVPAVLQIPAERRSHSEMSGVSIPE